MELRPLFAQFAASQKNKAESVLKVLKLTISDLNLQDIHYTEFQDKIVLSFRYNEKHAQTVAERFALNKLEIITDDEETKKAIEEAKRKLNKKDQKGFDGWDDGGESKKANLPLEQLIRNGEYGVLINISRDIRANKERRDGALSGLDGAISNAIKTNYSEGMKETLRAADRAAKLVSIASSSKLKFMQKSAFTHEAGLLAINLAGSTPHAFEKLIDMVNDSHIDPAVIVKAAAKFSAVVIMDSKPNIKAIDYAMEKANIANLQSAFEAVKDNFSQHEITKHEIMAVKKFVEFINDKRDSKK